MAVAAKARPARVVESSAQELPAARI